MNADEAKFLAGADAVATASAVKSGKIAATAVVNAALERIADRDQTLNCFTAITAESAIAAAEKIDNAIARNENPGPLAGVPFAVKNLFDVSGITTLAGSKINADNPPASQDAAGVARLRQAGAVLVGTLNMDEYAYGFVTENSHYGPTRNPRDTARIAGGSSGGSAAAVAAGLVPFTLGSDTNGSIRVPAALCGVFGFKPTYGRLSRAGAFLFSSSLDCVGPFGRSLRDMALLYDILQGPDDRDPVCTQRAPELCSPQLDIGIEGLRIAVADGYFAQGAEPEAMAAVEIVARALTNVLNCGIESEKTTTNPPKIGGLATVRIPESDRARAAAFIITACEGGNLHWENLRSRPQDFDPATRDRFLAGTLIPATWYVQAQRFRQWYRDRIREIFQHTDIILAPATPIAAPEIGVEKMVVAGQEILVRPNLGLFTQPLSFIGLPVLSVPVQRPGALPLGVQIVGAPYSEAVILRVAAVLESQGIISAESIHC
ncbi:MAG: AtzE family amidohydrolase [Microcoleus sp. PH2017_10_PVI_O_A]|uniref:AtzE family amidohydrolase n=1 Tax=unclassified Microcoleus TaxID=2642155 RepID=UPI001E187493|nr:MULTISPECIES: AtzE family amidohydrolase [unclassified Microcoleus]TAE75233.1 MAG: AtzE family amidohydrolase [Oscillatoriales cyanobacterium]MCC3409489.1 AtzE family amidohydrolase [Microcoleus sp. PH2017_10_PVI_O_A]MCC3464211.1 AtzE family amidohydrolase [Microcoleus sp. PH2017_11_PCY_U_A]MCC3482554.1 AtzE family amidohydrolase [Microcoleus sp. PH2017_12_PCY_D_A]MCC3563543.1 AtzE family amidohydrolase [Microcoleus sp. PH2017_27_LUM_O_A]